MSTSTDPAPTSAVRTARGFVPSLEGMRGFAAVGIVITHVAFQTGEAGSPVVGRIWGRFDLTVAIFFALSGFLLWRPHSAAARGMGPVQSTRRYLLSRATRILPAYWTVVVVVLLFLPNASGDYRVWLANLSLTQVFVPLTLTNGMTQMWSLSVEVAFYLLLPVFALLLRALEGDKARLRIPLITAVAILSLGWAYLPISTPDGIQQDNWLGGYLPWFAVGLILAELSVGPTTWLHRIAGRRTVMGVVAVAAFALSATPWAGPQGLTMPESWQYEIKILLGAVMAMALLAPLVLAESAAPHRILEHPITLALGRWSYGLFMWHLAVLSIVFPVFGIVPFNGNFVFMLVVTLGLSIPVAAASYALVEEPARRYFAGKLGTSRDLAAEPRGIKG